MKSNPDKASLNQLGLNTFPVSCLGLRTLSDRGRIGIVGLAPAPSAILPALKTGHLFSFAST